MILPGLALLAAAALNTLSSRADAVLFWNEVTAQSIFAAGRPVPGLVLDFAVVQAAVHDAVQAYDKTFEPYATEIFDASGSPAAAVAKATRDVLVHRLPSRAAAVDATYANYLVAEGLDADDPGVAVGAAAAAGMIAVRAGDGSFPAVPPVFNGASVIGMWRPTPSFLAGPPMGLSSMALPWMADVTPFVVLSADQFLSGPPARLNTGLYAREYNEVKSLGALVNSTRTPEQTQLAYFWAANFFLQINDVLRSLSQTHLDTSADRARLFALVWLSSSDALISTWNSKLEFPTWRPVTAIREGDLDGNPKTMGDPNWQPLINTPNYPEHCSGANCLVGGSMQMLALFFGTDQITFTVSTTNPNASPNTRTYHRFSDAAEDVVEARILQGIHYRRADREGRELGRNVANWTFEHALTPLQGEED